MDKTDKEIIQLLSIDARTSTTSLAATVGLSRSTVQERIKRLESSGIISGYTVRLSEGFTNRQIKAQVMISLMPKRQAEVVNALKKMVSVDALYAISGEYDLIARVSVDSTDDMDTTLDTIGLMEGIEKTRSSIILSTKFER
jgi:DNA-binding Lrp family transcriptional regulator